MQIFVDADACPVRDIIVRAARERNIPVVMVSDYSHVLVGDGYSTVVTVDKAKESADIALFNMLSAKDIVVTQDTGLAAMALGKGARVLGPGGFVFTGENIESCLMERHMGQKVRRGGGRTKGPRRRGPADDERFEAALIEMIGNQR